jgi:N-terminal half of MaoC dehydratase
MWGAPKDMYINKERALGLTIPPMTVDVERGRLRFFAETIGLTDPIYTDVEAAKRAGHRDLVAPPTFLGNSIELEQPDPLAWLAAVGVNLDRTTHGEQAFAYRSLAYAGDTLTLHRRITDVYLKKNGALEFVVKRTDITRGGEAIAEAYCTIGVRHPEVAA